MSPSSVLVVHAAATWFMVGLIWVIQLVHYPLFGFVGADGFPRYEAAHTRRMGWVLALPASLEVVTGAMLVWIRPEAVPLWLVFAAGFLLAVIWIVTAAVQVPLHARLTEAFDQGLVDRLVSSNRVRTALWSVRGALVAAMLLL